VLSFTINANQDAVVGALFIRDSNGHICFGTARSCDPVDESMLFEGLIRFKDYLMEAYVYYSLQLKASDSTVCLHIELEGSNRDRYVPSAVKSYIKSAGLTPMETLDQ